MTAPAPHQALYRRWRAQTFAQIVGQEAVVETLRNAVRAERVSHAILFVGPRGTGKTSLARILAKALNCTNLQDGDPCDGCEACVAIREGTTLDVLEIDAASNRGINEIRDLRERIQYAPAQLRRKVYILDEAHQITKDAWNALLKSLEEPPDFVVFMFASTHPQEFPPAILSRLQRYDVRRLTVPEIEGKLHRILEADSRDADAGAVHLIARLAAGGMRDAESMLDQLLASSADRLDEQRVRDLLGLADAESIERFLDALVDGDAAVGIAVLDALEERGRDLRIFLDQVVEALRQRLVAALGDRGARATADALAEAARRLASIDPNRAGSGGLRLQLELALFARAAAGPATAPRPTASTETTDRTAERTPAAPADARPAAPRVPAATSTVAAAEPVSTPESDARTPGKARKPERTAEPTRSAGPTPASRGDAPPPADAAPPADAPPSRPVPSAPTPASPDLQSLVVGWADVVASVSPATRAVLAECRPLAVDGNAVTLGFPESKPFLKDHAERKRPALEAAVGGFLGREVAVRCIATNLDLVAPPSDPDAAFVMAEARRIFADDLVDVGEVS